MAGLKGYDARILAADGTPVAFTNEACTDSGDQTTYEITASAKRYWDDATTVVVEVDDGGGFDVIPSSDYTIEHVGGRIIFAVALQPSDDVRVDGAYLPVTTVAGGTEWSADIETNVVDDSEFGDEWENPAVLQGKSGGSLKLKWADEAWFTRLDEGTKIVLILKISETSGLRFETFARITKDSITQSLTDLIREEVSWTGSGRIYPRE